MPRDFSPITLTSLYEYEKYAGENATAEGAAAYIQPDRDARWPPPANPAPIRPDDVNHNWEQRRLQSSPALSGLSPRPATSGPAASGSAAQPKVKMCKHKPPRPIDPLTFVGCNVTDNERASKNRKISKKAHDRVASRKLRANRHDDMVKDRAQSTQERAENMFGTGANANDYERLARRANRAGMKLEDVREKRPDMIEMIKSEITMRNWNGASGSQPT